MIIGLTGGIASGKSTAARALGDWGAHVIDADKLGHRAYLKGSAAFDAVVAAFGSDVIGQDGEIDRRALGGKVFGAPDKLKQLTDIVWPAIRDLARREIAQVRAESPETVIVLEAAVLLEAGWQDLVDEIWVTTVDRKTAIDRASARDGVDAAAIEARIDAQLSNEERVRAAHRVFDNAAGPEQLITSLRAAWSELGERTA